MVQAQRKHPVAKLLKKDSPEYAKAMLRDQNALMLEANRRGVSAELLAYAMRAQAAGQAS